MASAILPSRPPVPFPEAQLIAGNKAHQLRHLLSAMYGNGKEWVDEMGADRRDALLWLAADLAGDVERLVDSLAFAKGSEATNV